MRFSIYTFIFSIATLAMSQNVRAPVANDDNGLLAWRVGKRTSATTERLATESLTNLNTGEVTTKNHRYVLAGSGLNYQDEAGEWQPSQDLIELQPDGSAAAVRSPTKIYLAANLNTPSALTIVTPEKTVLKTRILGLFYYDAATGRAVLLSKVKDSVAELLPPNQLVYRDALNCGDIRVTCTKAGFETDFILTKQPKPPEAYSLTPATTRLELWHQYDGAPVPRRFERTVAREMDPDRRKRMAEPDLVDEIINIEHLWFPLGRAFSTFGQDDRSAQLPAKIRLPNSANPGDRTSVAKRWMRIEEREVLVESLPWSSIAPEIQALPKLAGVGQGKPTDEIFTGRRLPRLAQAPTGTGERIKVAASKYRPTGFVMDYIVVYGNGDFTFENGTTYLIDSNIITDGTVTFESGSVVKYLDGGMAVLYGTIVCNGSSVLTSKDEDGFGETISGSSHTPAFFAAPAIWIYYVTEAVTLSNLRIRWAETAIQFDAGSCQELTHTVQNSAFEFCQTGIYANNCNISLSSVTACNVTAPTSSPDPYCANFSGSIGAGSGCDSDTDGNGIPDSWEFRYFGTIHVDPWADPDSDAVATTYEYLQGRNPIVAGTTADSNNQINLQAYTPLK